MRKRRPKHTAVQLMCSSEPTAGIPVFAAREPSPGPTTLAARLWAHPPVVPGPDLHHVAPLAPDLPAGAPACLLNP